MRVVIAAGIVLVLIAVVGAYVRWVRHVLSMRRDHRLRQGANWQVTQYGEDGRTYVCASLVASNGRVLERRLVAAIDDGDEDWERKFVAARDRAAERVFHLNSGTTETGGELTAHDH